MPDEEVDSFGDMPAQVHGKQVHEYELGGGAPGAEAITSELGRPWPAVRQGPTFVKHSEAQDLASDADELDVSSLHKFWHRAGWLVLLLMCQSTSSLILEHFEMLIHSHPVVIYFLTMLVGAGGNAGGQSTVLVVRKLALAAVGGGKSSTDGDPRFSVRNIVGSEVSVGARLAVVLFCASFVRCVFFQVRGVECVAICLSMLVIVFTSTLVGAALPLLLQKFHIDPAHAGATIQVVMDITGVALTCVVSCLVLGLPISGKSSAAAALAAASTKAPVGTGAVTTGHASPGLGIHNLGTKTAHVMHRP